MPETVIKVENLSKLYQLGSIGYGTLKQDIQTWWHHVRGKEDPNSKIHSGKIYKGENEDFWALTDINFEAKKGESIAIVGKNGAGKSTLLKILSKITTPTTGQIKLRGKISSLLEVGTGFHAELTGRENIYMNGAILGMKRSEIKNRFDEIVSFSAIEKFIDTPLKRYSSGMYLRLAFAVAAHLNSDILIFDEVLAVGDIEFQKKCLGKMDDVTKNQGRTILFVSHNMGSVKELCQKGLLLEKGKTAGMTDIDECINNYLQSFYRSDGSAMEIKTTGHEVEITSILVNDNPVAANAYLNSGDKLKIQFSYQNHTDTEYDFIISFGLKNTNNNLLFFTHNHLENFRFTTKKTGTVSVLIDIPKLAPGDYFLTMQIWLDGLIKFHETEVLKIIVMETPAFKSRQTFKSFPSDLMVDSEWSLM